MYIFWFPSVLDIKETKKTHWNELGRAKKIVHESSHAIINQTLLVLIPLRNLSLIL